MVSGYKQNQISSMSPELWKAKKIVDSTLHPGILFFFSVEMNCFMADFLLRRYRGASLSSVSHVVLCSFQPGCHGRYAYTGAQGMFVDGEKSFDNA